ncbi:DUF128 domain-containing protein [Kiritimatiella glycovorans]|uniref:Putative transcriptional repressor n=1 Tax=Kiritimatiella glycovorans TaxID=1307763 RepID=A0A0G3EGD0_9BACT|nr:NrpR regulatory domain-containing protein [Kiritimatiella glycovorans]AKJ63840.1 putative transcriptional repressor [Kiritimatiella glycovorans]
MDKRARKRWAILDVLKGAREPMSGGRVAAELAGRGMEISERTVRLYLRELDREGLTEHHGRRGRTITDRGRSEAEDSRALERVGFLSARIDQMAYRMQLDLATREGTVVVNTTTLPRSAVTPERLELVSEVFASGYAMGRLITLYMPGERYGRDQEIGPDEIGLGTVCSITLNGVLLRRGIPTYSRFGGLLDVRDGKPTRFVEIINYEGTSIDPLEIFIRSGMTDYTGAVRGGSGRIGASFREFPAESEEAVRSVASELEEAGLGSLMVLGGPGQSILDIPVGPDRVGAVIIGGLNPVAVFEESGVRVRATALAGLADVHRFFPYTRLAEKIGD